MIAEGTRVGGLEGGWTNVKRAIELHDDISHSFAGTDDDARYRGWLEKPPSGEGEFSLAVIVEERRVDDDTIQGPLELSWELQGLLVVIKDKLGEDVETIVVLKQHQLRPIFDGLLSHNVLESNKGARGREDADCRRG